MNEIIGLGIAVTALATFFGTALAYVLIKSWREDRDRNRRAWPQHDA